jgi:dihydroflavonol-4-reductase
LIQGKVQGDTTALFQRSPGESFEKLLCALLEISGLFQKSPRILLDNCLKTDKILKLQQVKSVLKALVTGSTGFIGSHLVESLAQRGVQARCLVRKTSDLKWLKGLPVEFVYGDCNEKGSLKGAVKGVDQVFHLAGVTKAIDEKTYFETNALGTENLIHACLEHSPRLQKFIYLSSQAAAGPCHNGRKKKESDECEPVSPYGRSKRLGEKLAIEHAHELPLLILRPSAVYGPRDRDIYAFFKLLSKRIKLCIVGQDQHLSLCYVQDIIEAILLASESRESNGEIFFLSDGRDYRMDEIGDVFAQAIGISPFCIPVPKWVIFGIASFSEYLSKLSGKPALISKGMAEQMVQEDWGCDITKARTVLGFEPRIHLAQGAKLTVDWYRKENWL